MCWVGEVVDSYYRQTRGAPLPCPRASHSVRCECPCPLSEVSESTRDGVEVLEDGEEMRTVGREGGGFDGFLGVSFGLRQEGR